MSATSSWEAEAKNRGYPGEKEMWEALYPKFSLSQLAEMFKKGINTIRDRVAKSGLPIQKRGGPNNEKVEMDPNLMESIITKGVRKTAEDLGIRPQLLYQRVYYKYGLKIKDLKAARSEEDQPSSTSLPKSDHEPPV